VLPGGWEGSPFHELPQIFCCYEDDDAIATLHRWIERKADPSPLSRGVQVVPSHVAEVGEEDQVVYGNLGLVPRPSVTNAQALGQIPVEIRSQVVEQASLDAVNNNRPIRRKPNK
jgi:hypothetical protein